jgi:hypothetical protein
MVYFCTLTLPPSPVHPSPSLIVGQLIYQWRGGVVAPPPDPKPPPQTLSVSLPVSE